MFLHIVYISVVALNTLSHIVQGDIYIMFVHMVGDVGCIIDDFSALGAVVSDIGDKLRTIKIYNTDLVSLQMVDDGCLQVAYISTIGAYICEMYIIFAHIVYNASQSNVYNSTICAGEGDIFMVFVHLILVEFIIYSVFVQFKTYWS